MVLFIAHLPMVSLVSTHYKIKTLIVCSYRKIYDVKIMVI
jgi:hypothetical protein